MARRRYVAPRRQAQAATTRRAIVDAARRLFANHGYGSTTLAAIAAAAGVAVQTVYAIFGTKRAILSALIDSMESEAQLPRLLSQLGQPGITPAEQLTLVVRFNRRLWERALDVLEIARGAAGAEPELADFHREGEARRRAGQAPLIRAWHRAGVVRARLSVRAAGDILWTLSGPDVYRLLIIESHWSGSRYEAWLEGVLRRELFAAT